MLYYVHFGMTVIKVFYFIPNSIIHRVLAIAILSVRLSVI